MKTPYEILGVNKDATQDEIKKAYKTNASKHHPDKNIGDDTATARFQEIQQAYALLSNPEKRKRYDETGATSDEPTISEYAMQTIMNIFDHMLTQHQFVERDYITMVRAEVNETLSRCKREIQQARKSLARLDILVTKMEVNEQVIELLNSKRKECKATIEHGERGIDVMTEALTILKDFKYTGDLNTFSGTVQIDPYFA